MNVKYQWISNIPATVRNYKDKNLFHKSDKNLKHLEKWA